MNAAPRVQARVLLVGVLSAALAACQGSTPSGSPAAPQASRGCGPAGAPAEASAGCGPATFAPTQAPISMAPAGTTPPASPASGLRFSVETFPVARGAHPHDVAAASDGGVWYTGQRNGTLGWLDPATGDVREADLPDGAAPHGVIAGPDGAAWVTDQGLDAIVRVTPGAFEVEVFRAPRGTSPHTGVFDADGIMWFTGASGFIGRLDPSTGEIDTFPTPRGNGPYGITATPGGDIWFVSLAKSYLGKVDKVTGDVTVVEPPTANAGTRRVWSDSRGRLWVSYWNAGMVAVYDPAAKSWQEWDLPGGRNSAYSIYVDELDAVWLSDFGQNAIVRFDPPTESFETFESDTPNAAVRQMLGRPGEAWGAESGLDRLVVVRYGRT